ncbi:hypothetical protein CCAX7_59200 [Capsulimonas corticalis]|uniref:Uncharacterized protein n=1 Tax=Capsulimonas corticalis TaxID=2219043 RepID=A0A402CZR2_9BACT|nr:DUF2244 domain-containing protein [Capsulimonas corticalis]BDI33869.1 hypothetical protein CCAX7_59200 [Capsulimonas corticalis]
MLLQEIPGAIERPAGCNIQVTQERDAAEITIPPRRATWIDKIPTTLYVFSLFTFFYVGLVFFISKRLIIGPELNMDHGHISRYLNHYIYWLLPVWLAFEAIGWGTVYLVMRPFFTTETLRISREGVAITRAVPFSRKRSLLLRENLRGFLLRRDPQGMWGSTLALRSVGEEIEIGEFTGEAEREWLASVGNALLGRY